jgi:putative tryptophan/tyrosine transport system substrate-binding protein
MALPRTGKPAIGFLNSGSLQGMTSQLEAFQQGLKLGGYVDGQDVTIEYRWADSDYDRMAEYAADLAGRDLVLIAATGGTQTALAVRNASSKIPLLFIAGGPTGQNKIVPYLEGRNATGVNVEQIPTTARRIEFLNQVVPRHSKIISLVYDNMGGKLERENVLKSARQSEQQVQFVEAKNVDELRAVLGNSKQANTALLVHADPFFFTQRRLIAEQASTSEIPAIYPWREFVDAGGLMSYGPNLVKAYRQIGLYAALMLEGAAPDSLPILQATSFDLVINLNAAKALNIRIPPTLLARADQIIQ